MSRALVLAVMMMVSRVAWSDPLADARAAVASSDYGAARPALAAALQSGSRGPEELVEIYRLTGVVEAALGDAKAATDAFTRLLSLEPTASLPAGTSPKLRRPFDAAARYAKTHAALAVKLETSASPPTVTLVVVSDPLAMIAKARVVYAVDGGPERTKEMVASERTDVALQPGRRIDARLAAIDAYGNRLIELGSKEVPIVIVGEQAAAPAPVAARPVEPTSPRPRGAAGPPLARPLWRRWWPYAAGSVVLGGVATYFAWSARSDAQELERLNADSVRHQFSEARAVEDRARRSALVANVGFAVAGGVAVVAGVMWFTSRRDEPDARDDRARVSAVPLPGGGALVYGGNF